jgi:hypothetical protein
MVSEESKVQRERFFDWDLKGLMKLCHMIECLFDLGEKK